MSMGLATLQGIGQGLMQGSQFVQNQNVQNARLGMLQEQQDWQRQDRDAAEAERARVQKLTELRRGAWQQFGTDADPVKVERFVMQEAMKLGLPGDAELRALGEANTRLKEQGLQTAFTEATTGNFASLNRFFSEQFGEPVAADAVMQQDEFGLPVKLFRVRNKQGRVIGEMNSMQLGAMMGIGGWAAEQDAARVKGAETRSKIVENQAQARKADADARKVGQEGRRELSFDEYQKLSPEERAAYGEFRTARGGSGTTGKGPSEVQTAEWLIRNNVAQDASQAWELVRTTRGKSPEEAIASLVIRMKADPMNFGRTDEELVSDARSIYSQINSTSPKQTSAGQESDQPVQVSSPEEAMKLPPGTIFITPEGRRMRVPARKE